MRRRSRSHPTRRHPPSRRRRSSSAPRASAFRDSAIPLLTSTLLQRPGFGNGAIVDTVAAVFRGIDTTPQHPPLWLVIARWIGAWLARVLNALSGHPAANVIVRVAVVVAILVIAARIFLPGFALPERANRTAHGTQRDDWWGLAARLASEGAFTDAAHALYVALVTAAAARGLVVVHESKTTGDYLREVRRARGGRLSPAELAGWRDFVRVYDTAIYGLRTVSDAEYETLRSLATTALGDHAAGGRAPRERTVAGAHS